VRIERTEIEGVAILRWELVGDERGSFARTFCKEEMQAAGLAFEVHQTNISRNLAIHTLRGLHMQREPHAEAKIIYCPRGRIWDVAVDMRPDSATYRRWLCLELHEGGDRAWHLPRGVAHGFLTLEADSEVHYLMGAPYVPAAGSGFRWDDPAIGIDWPHPPEVISERDRGYPLLERE
jgi:dTDP-4-dehydrorhamnose 3,5-epimerase